MMNRLPERSRASFIQSEDLWNTVPADVLSKEYLVFRGGMRLRIEAVRQLNRSEVVATLLQFVRFEPYVIPKVSLTGDTTERVDTRVLQAIYSFERGNLPIYVGQQMDVYIDVSPESARELSSLNPRGRLSWVRKKRIVFGKQ